MKMSQSKVVFAHYAFFFILGVLFGRSSVQLDIYSSSWVIKPQMVEIKNEKLQGFGSSQTL